jgi:hypothetical protein
MVFPAMLPAESRHPVKSVTPVNWRARPIAVPIGPISGCAG